MVNAKYRAIVDSRKRCEALIQYEVRKSYENRGSQNDYLLKPLSSRSKEIAVTFELNFVIWQHIVVSINVPVGSPILIVPVGHPKVAIYLFGQSPLPWGR